jgi:hypothetical protein
MTQGWVARNKNKKGKKQKGLPGYGCTTLRQETKNNNNNNNKDERSSCRLDT